MLTINNQQAEQLINKCQAEYTADKFHFEFNLSMFFAGDHNKKLRQDIIEFLTGQRPPASKSGLHKVAEVLKNKFEQFTLF